MSENNLSFKQELEKGHSAAWDGDWEKAVEHYRLALQHAPNHPSALSNLGLALIELGEYEEALKCYLQVSSLTPADPVPVEKAAELFEKLSRWEETLKASLRAGELYSKTGEWDKAIENWSRAARIYPDNLLAHSRLAYAYAMKKENEKAADAYLVAASILQHAGDEAKAERAVQQALKVLPSHTAAKKALHLLRESKPLPRPAVVSPRKKSEPGPSHPRLKAPAEKRAEPQNDPVATACRAALAVMAGALFDKSEEQGLDKESARGLKDIIAGTGRLRKPVDQTRMMLHLSQAVALQTEGRFAEASDELQQAMDFGMEHPAVNYDLGFLFTQSGRWESAAKALKRALQHQDYALASRLLLGEIAYKRGALEEAMIEYLEALRIADLQFVPEKARSTLNQYYESIIEADRESFPAEVQERIIENVRELLMSPDWKMKVRRSRRELGDGDRSGMVRPLAEMLTEARGSKVVDEIVNVNRLVEAGKLRSAMEEAFFALHNAPLYLPLHTVIGDLLVAQGEATTAVEKYMVVARAYSTRGDSQMAVNLYRRIVELSPLDLNAHQVLVDQLVLSGRYDEAVREYDQLGEAFYNQADFRMARKTYAKALEVAQQAGLSDDWALKFMHAIADIDLQSLDWKRAIRMFEQIRLKSPGDAEARRQLIELNFRLGQQKQALEELDSFLTHLLGLSHKDEAVEFVKGLLEEYPDILHIRQRMADLYRQKGLVAEAVEQLDFIGEKLLDAGDRQGAIRIIEQIIALEPPNKAEYQELIGEIRAG